MSSETITRNDLTNILNEVLPPPKPEGPVGNSAVPIYIDNAGEFQPVDTITIGLIQKPLMKVTGSSGDMTVSGGAVITQVPLTVIEISSEYSGISLDTTKNTILVEPGIYQVTGSLYFPNGGGTGTQGVYIRMGLTDTTFTNATEVAASYIIGTTSINTTTVVKAIDNCYIWLGARGPANTRVQLNNTATYLIVEKIGSVY